MRDGAGSRSIATTARRKHMPVSDFRINSAVRSCLARHWIDTQQVSFGSFRGTVRISGKLCRLAGETRGELIPPDIDVLDTEIRRVEGVHVVHFDLCNWRKDSRGEWVAAVRAVPVASQGAGDDEKTTVIVMRTRRAAAPTGTPEESPGGDTRT